MREEDDQAQNIQDHRVLRHETTVRLEEAALEVILRDACQARVHGQKTLLILNELEILVQAVSNGLRLLDSGLELRLVGVISIRQLQKRLKQETIARDTCEGNQDSSSSS